VILSHGGRRAERGSPPVRAGSAADRQTVDNSGQRWSPNVSQIRRSLHLWPSDLEWRRHATWSSSLPTSTTTSTTTRDQGQITLLKAIREALGLHAGWKGAVLARTADLLDLAGATSLTASRRGAPWEKVRRQVRAARVRSRR
jgi:hypothetical protein